MVSLRKRERPKSTRTFLFNSELHMIFSFLMSPWMIPRECIIFSDDLRLDSRLCYLGLEQLSMQNSIESLKMIMSKPQCINILGPTLRAENSLQKQYSMIALSRFFEMSFLSRDSSLSSSWFSKLLYGIVLMTLWICFSSMPL